MKYIKNAVFVDPGWNTGTAIYEENKTLHPEVKLLKCEKGSTEYLEKIEDISHKFTMEIVTKYKIKTCIIEGIEFWKSSVKSAMAFGTGDVIALGYLVGSIIKVCINHGILVDVRTFNEWGGQLQPEQVRRRVIMRNGMDYRTLYSSKSDAQHIFDAVGMSFAIMGVL